jgi:hypothetical protein
MIEPIRHPELARRDINWRAVVLELVPLLSLPLLIAASGEDLFVWLLLPLAPALATGLGWWLIGRADWDFSLRWRASSSSALRG